MADLLHQPVPAYAPDERLPTRVAALLFRGKALCFQTRRLWRDAWGRGPRKHRPAERLAHADVCGEWRRDLWHESAAQRERALLLGKVQNLRAAARLLNGVEVP